MPVWLTASPWILAACALTLAILIYALGIGDRKESEISEALYLERGASLLQAYEATLQAGVGLRWSDDELQAVLDELATAPDIHYMAVTDADGVVLAASTQDLVGRRLPGAEAMRAMPPENAAQGWTEISHQATPDQAPADIFLVFKSIADPQNRERLLQHGHNMMRRMRPGMMMQHPWNSPPPAKPLLALVGYDIAPLLAAREADARRALVNGVLLTVLALAGALTLFLIKNDQRSRRLVQESSAFSFALVDTMPIGIVAVNEHGRITAFNPQAARITGLEAAEALGKALTKTLPGLEPAFLAGVQANQRGEKPHEQELRVLFGQKTRIPLAIGVTPIVTEEGAARGYTITLRDMGEIRRLQAEVRRQDRLAALGGMAAGIAHEIRNPLGAIKGLARFFQESSPAGSQEANIADSMTQEVLRLDNVVGGLLELARPDSLSLAPVDLPPFFGRLADMVRGDVEAAGIVLELDIPASSPAVLMDADRMTQVFLNLLLNAVQAMPQGGGLGVRAVFAGDGDTAAYSQVLFEVTDSGQGIAREDLDSIFRPYFTTKAQGTGLGLSLAQKIVEAHDGEIGVSSVPGQGTSFRITLPLFPCPDKAATREAS